MPDLVVVVADYSEFGPDRPKGFVVCTYGERDGRTFLQIPAWEEMGYGDLAEVFPTREAAEAAIPICW